MNNLGKSKVLNEKLWKSWEIAALIKLRINWNSTPETASVKTIWERWRQNKVIKKHQMNGVKWLKIQVNVLSLIEESRETEKSQHDTAWEMVETGMSDEDDDHNSQDDTVLAPLVRGSSWRWGKYLTEMKKYFNWTELVSDTSCQLNSSDNDIHLTWDIHCTWQLMTTGSLIWNTL